MRIVSITVFSLIATSMNALLIQKASQIEKRTLPFPADAHESGHQSHQLDITQSSIASQSTESSIVSQPTESSIASQSTEVQPNTNPTPTQKLACATGLSTTPHAVQPNYEPNDVWIRKINDMKFARKKLSFKLKTKTDPDELEAIEDQILAIDETIQDQTRERGILLREYGAPTVTITEILRPTATAQVKPPWSYEEFIAKRKAAYLMRMEFLKQYGGEIDDEWM
ncbi:hypothetical protein BASA61_006502 [Batrachochytrium salamandrivorans]|nr:hypothetical protein BASA61_006502 [Batrachochytrium salamandrivorans]KAH9273141.1 hypothetical protein BASA83_004430 [Batrachochytrium salamandrivorans]